MGIDPTLTATPTFTSTATSIATALDGASSLNLTSGVTTLTTGAYYFNCVNIGTGAVVTISGGVTIFTECFTLNAGATITGIGMGYPGNFGEDPNPPLTVVLNPGYAYPGPNPGYESSGATPYECSGGGHGGAGGSSCQPILTSGSGCANGGAANDDPIYPSLMGSGGGIVSGAPFATAGYPGNSEGGALLRLVVYNPSSNTLGPAIINGTIDMSGVKGCYDCGPLEEGGGGGAGGTILIEASTLSGAGLLQANGGPSTGNYGGGGGGGIISLITNTNPFPGIISVVGTGGGGGLVSEEGNAGIVSYTPAPPIGY